MSVQTTPAASAPAPAKAPPPTKAETLSAFHTDDDGEVGEYEAQIPAGPGDGISDGETDDETSEDSSVTDADVADADPAKTSDDGDAEEPGETGDEADTESTAAAEPDVEEIEVTDHRGRRTVKVDFSDRTKLKRIVQQAAGAQKLAAELKQLRTDLEAKGGDAEVGGRVSKAWAEGGVDGLIRELTGGKQTWDSVFAQRKQLEEQLAAMSPAERVAYDAKQDAERARAETAALRADAEARSKKAQEDTDAAERATVQSHMDGGFTKYRFAGKLGDEAREHRLDKLLWNGVRAELAELPDDAVITPKLVAETFAEHAKAIRDTISTEVRKETKRVVKQKGREAKSQAQAAMAAATEKQPTSAADQKMKKGDLRGGFLAALRAAARG